MNRIIFFLIFIFFSQIYYVQSPIPSWELSSQSIELFSSKNPEIFLRYKAEYDGITPILNKEITKSENGITIKNKLTIGSTTKEVEFDEIDSHYKDKLGAGILICPKGKFHPYDFNNNKYIDLGSSGFVDKGGWDLRCYRHDEGYFFIFYLLNDGKNVFYSLNGGTISERDAVYSFLYDYRLENGLHENKDNFEYKFSQLRFQAYQNGDKYLILDPGVFIFNKENGYINKNTIGSYKNIILAKNNTQAYFNTNHKFFFFTYNNATDFQSGFSYSYVNFDDKPSYENSIRDMTFAINQNSPLTFVDNVEIKELKLVLESKYAFYKIYNKDKEKTFYGLIDIVTNKVLYNIEGNFTTFIPISTHEMLAVNETSAYKICIIKSSGDGNIYCSESCSNYNLILDPTGNKCQSDCGSKIKLMPEGICIDSNLCDRNIYELSSDEKECGLCS